MIDTVLTFAGAHPVVAVLIAIPLIGWSARILITVIQKL